MDPSEYEPDPLFAEGVPGGVDDDFDDSRDYELPSNNHEAY